MKNVLGKIVIILVILSLSVVNNTFCFSDNKNKEIDNCANAAKTTNNVSVYGSNSVSNVLASELGNEQEEEAESYVISNIEISNSCIEVDYSVLKASSIIIGLYDENDNTMYNRFVEIISEKENHKEINISQDIKKYFVVKAYIIDPESYKPLSKEYTSNYYTKDFHDSFASKDIDDFPTELAYNLDENKKTNFCVFESDTLFIDESDVLHKDNDSITIRSDQSVQLGSIVVIKDKSEVINIYKVEKFDKNDNDYKLEISNNYCVRDVFGFVKVEMDDDLNRFKADMDDASEGVSLYGGKSRNNKSKALIDREADYTNSNSIELGLSYSKKSDSNKIKLEVSGKLDIKSHTLAKIYIDKNYSEVRFVLKSDIQMRIQASINASHTFELGKYELISPIGIGVGIEPELSMSGKIEASIQGSLETQVGGKIDTKDGFQNLTTAPRFTPVDKYSIELTIELGIDLNPSVFFLDADFISIKLSDKVSILTTVKLTNEKSSTEKHDCKGPCLDGTVDLKAKIGISFNVEITDQLVLFRKGVSKSFDLHLMDYYYCFEHKDGGIGKCPYRSFKTVLRIRNLADEIVENAELYIHGVSDKLNIKVDKKMLSDKNGLVSLFLHTGEYTVESKKENYVDKTFKIKVNDKASKQTLGIEYIYPVRIHVFDGMNNKQPIKNAKVIIGGKTISTDEQGVSLFRLQKGLYGINVSAKGYATLKKEDFFTIKTKNSSYVYDIDVDLYNEAKAPYLAKDSVEGNCWSAFLTRNGDLYVQGSFNSLFPRQFQLYKENISKISAYEDMLAMITDDDKLLVAGSNIYVGDGTEKKTVNNPIEVMADIKEVACGEGFVLVLKKDGTIWSFGEDKSGSLGLGDVKKQLTPTQIGIDEKISKIDCGVNTCAAIAQDGDLYMWGNNYGKYGDGTSNSSNTPKKVYENVDKISIGSDHTGIIKKDKLLLSGKNAHGSLYPEIKNSNSFIEVLSNVNEIECGYDTTFILMNQTLYMWGYNFEGQAGQEGLANVVKEPTEVPLETVSHIGQLSVFSGEHPIAITVNGELYGWGDNSNYAFLNDGDSILLNYNYTIMNIPIKSTINRNNIYDYYSNGEIKKQKSRENIESQEYNEEDNHITFRNLKEDIYNCYMFKNELNESPENLLFVGQNNSENGICGFSYGKSLENENDYVHKCVIGKNSNVLKDDNVRVEDLMYSGKEMDCDISVEYDNKTLIEGKDYILLGDYLAKYSGEYVVLVEGIGDYSGTVSIKYNVKPNPNLPENSDETTISKTNKSSNNITNNVKKTNIKRTKILKLKSKKKSLLIRWKRVRKVKGYEIHISRTKKFKKCKKYVVKKARKNSILVRKLKKKTKYYVRVRSYAKTRGVKRYSKWSKVAMKMTR